MATVEKKPVSTGNVIEYLDVIDILVRALDYTGEKLGGYNQDYAKKLLVGLDIDAHSYFRYAVAMETVKLLRVINDDIRAAYLVGEAEERQIPHSYPITIVAQVGRKSAAFEAILGIICARLLKSYQSMMGEAAEQLQYFMDIQIIDENSARVFGFMNPPLCLWNANQ